MTAQFAGAADATRVFDPYRLDAYVAANDFDRPTLVIDVDRVEEQYNALKAGLGRADIHYAVKANPALDVIHRLVQKGSHFDAASRAEIEICLSQGARPETISTQAFLLRPYQQRAVEWAKSGADGLIIAPAGSGKTLLACQIALNLLLDRKVKQIVITRPTVSKEDIGHLPGGINEKMDPWVAPIYANMYQL
ncbi:MAG: hypothetical protein EBV86_16625, partial [Marivivens sp.]|nr:hypothetical protein [Marivivens sp.]